MSIDRSGQPGQLGHPAQQVQTEAMGQEPRKPRKSRKPLIITLSIVGALIIGAGIATPFIIGQVQHAEAVREYDMAAQDLDAARGALTSALDDATREVESAGVVTSVVSSERVSDTSVLDRLDTAMTTVEMVAVPPAGGEFVRERPVDTAELVEAAEQLRVETVEVRDEAAVVEEASEGLWNAQLEVVDSVVAKGEEMLASGKVDEAEAAELQSALDALQSGQLVRGETDLGALLGHLDTSWVAAEATMSASWDDAAGEWCDFRVAPSCITIAGMQMTPDSAPTQVWFIEDTEVLGECIYSVINAPGVGYGGLPSLTYCPAGAPTPHGMKTQPLGLPGEDLYNGPGDDETRERVFRSGGSPYFRP